MILYFYPGLGADSTLAPLHVIPGFEIRWIDWPEKIGSSWEEFISSIKAENRIESGAIHIGISFGGSVAQRMACDTGGKDLDLFYRMAARTGFSLSGTRKSTLEPRVGDIRFP